MLSSLQSAVWGAGFMYLFDPDRGEERRRVLQDKLTQLTQSLQPADQGDAGAAASGSQCASMSAVGAASVLLATYGFLARAPLACLAGTVGLGCCLTNAASCATGAGGSQSATHNALVGTGRQGTERVDSGRGRSDFGGETAPRAQAANQG